MIATTTEANQRTPGRTTGHTFLPRRSSSSRSNAIAWRRRMTIILCVGLPMALATTWNGVERQQRSLATCPGGRNRPVLPRKRQSTNLDAKGTHTPTRTVAIHSSTHVANLNRCGATAFRETPKLNPRLLNLITFLLVGSSALTALTPAPTLVAAWGAATATTALSILTGCAALVELVASAPLGAWMDRIGRQPVVVAVTAAVPAAHAIVALLALLLPSSPSATPSAPSPLPTVVVWAMLAAKGVAMLAFPVYTLASQAILSDWSLQKAATAHKSPQSSQSALSAAIGLQMASVSSAFFLALVAAGALHRGGPALVYGTSAVLGAFTALLTWLRLPETLTTTTTVVSVPASSKSTSSGAGRSPTAPTKSSSLLSAPLAAGRLLWRHGPRVRVLAILLLLLTLPMHQGDMFQVYARHEWNLETPAFSQYLALYGAVGMVAQAAASGLLPRIGTRPFTLLAIASRLVAIVLTIGWGYRGAVIGVILGCLGAAQSIGIVGALVTAGVQTGLAPGELAGERSALLALLKVVGPLLYSSLYIQGTRIGRPNLPFFFNVVVSLTAGIVAWLFLT